MKIQLSRFHIVAILVLSSLISCKDNPTHINESIEVVIDSSLYKIKFKVNLIDIDGSQIDPKAVSLYFKNEFHPSDSFSNQILSTDSAGIYELVIDSDSVELHPINYHINKTLYHSESNFQSTFVEGGTKVFYNQVYENFSTDSGIVDFGNTDNKNIEKNITLKKYAELYDYTPKIGIGTTWIYSIFESNRYDEFSEFSYDGNLKWEVIEQQSDSSFTIAQTFTGVEDVYIDGENGWINEDYKHERLMKLTLSNGKMKFSSPTDYSYRFKSTFLAPKFFLEPYELNMIHPLTTDSSYSTSANILINWSSGGPGTIIYPQFAYTSYSFEKQIGLTEFTFDVQYVPSKEIRLGLLEFKN